jgi:hypothetical protein
MLLWDTDRLALPRIVERRQLLLEALIGGIDPRFATPGRTVLASDASRLPEHPP